jgi:hypothetical protein
MDKTKKLKALRGFALNKTPHRRVGHEPTNLRLKFTINY